ncbi:MAG: hypothetical protein CVU42_00145 [Chloroflexi bacterium HGW-Chloroflexi-4]|nr:MAG: hypothetical protein CVU42_00145 [Chloroflexi bacterium HGW-Chloroflexi-4]
MKRTNDFSISKLQELLRMPSEKDWLEFKSEYKLFTSEGKVADKARDEFIKDILGLANGNSQIIRKTKYLIIGVDDSKFGENHERELHNIDYQIPTQNDISVWLKDSCTPAIAGIECEEWIYESSKILVIIIPPTFNLHETARDLLASSGRFHKYTVFMRQNENTVPASVRDGITIQQLKFMHRQEISNPRSIFIGLLVGGIISWITANAIVNTKYLPVQFSEKLIISTLTFVGVLMGAMIGLIMQQFNDMRYSLRYMTWRNRILFVSSLLIMFAIIYLVMPK